MFRIAISLICVNTVESMNKPQSHGRIVVTDRDPEIRSIANWPPHLRHNERCDTRHKKLDERNWTDAGLTNN